MLHILLLILKILGIILAIILGLIVLIVCIVLFVPVCYRAEGEAEGSVSSLRIRGQISWLFGLVKIVVSLKGKEPDYYIKIAWKKLGEQKKQKTARKREEDNYELDSDIISGCETEIETSEKKSEKKNTETIRKNTSEDVEKLEESKKIPEKEPTVSEQTGKDEGEEVEKESKIQKIILKIKRITDNIKCTIKRFCDKIKEISEKKEHITEFVTDETHLHALAKTKKELFKLLRRILPAYIQSNIRFGFDDPSLTGRILAILGALYPFLGENVNVTPDFQEKVLEGDFRLKGRIYVVHPVLLALNLLLCKDVRKTIKDIKAFKL